MTLIDVTRYNCIQLCVNWISIFLINFYIIPSFGINIKLFQSVHVWELTNLNTSTNFYFGVVKSFVLMTDDGQYHRYSWRIKEVKEKFSRYRSGMTQRLGRGIALLFHDRGTRRRWVVSSTPRPHFTPVTHFTGGWVGPRTGLDGRKISFPPGYSIPDLPARSQSLYRLSYPAHTLGVY